MASGGGRSPQSGIFSSKIGPKMGPTPTTEPYMAVYGGIWPYMALYGHIWPYVVVYGWI